MIEALHSYLVLPAKHLPEQPPISGAELPRQGSLFAMLRGVFDRAPTECDIDIKFRHDDEGLQNNPCRDLVVAYSQEPSLENGRGLAARLQSITTNRSHLGLLFLMKGAVAGRHVVVVSRFPADQGVIAQEHAGELEVEFIERVFMKTAKAYKSVVYSSDSFERGFWDGKAIDRQVSGARELSDYWIYDFLASELRTSSEQGTMRVAVALRTAIRSTDQLSIRHELISAANLLRGYDGRTQSARHMIGHVGLSDQAATMMQDAFPRADLMDEVFRFSRQEFERHVLYRVMELDSGAVLIAEDSTFDTVYREEPTSAPGHVRITTEGAIVSETLRKTK